MQNRVYGFDFLRGLLAFGVMIYHLLSWSGVAHLYNLGLYGVYGFFVLSGASMMVAYGDRLKTLDDLVPYLTHRVFRIMPLLVAVGLVWPVLVEVLSGAGAAGRGLVLNTTTFFTITPLFGFTNPGATGSVAGGWSLGIEFIFYLVFPVMLALSRRGIWVALGMCLLFGIVQVVFVNYILAGKTLDQTWPLYTQFGAFGFYFAAGVLIGWLVNNQSAVFGRPWLGAAVFTAGGLVLLACSGSTAEASLIGLRGFGLMLVTCAVVATAAALRFSGMGVLVAEWLGILSYPVYLIHPIVWADTPRLVEKFTGQSSWQLNVAFVAVVTAVLSAVSWRVIERPFIRLGKKLFP